ncbi:MAG: hypothetical protein ACOX52_02835 [Verrucomicrobiota bacterium]
MRMRLPFRTGSSYTKLDSISDPDPDSDNDRTDRQPLSGGDA